MGIRPLPRARLLIIQGSFGSLVALAVPGVIRASLWLMEGLVLAAGICAIGFLALSIWVGWLGGVADRRSSERLV